MKNKYLLNGFILSLMLTPLSAQAQPAWIATIQQYFSKPTQTALIATTAVAGISLLTTFACAWKLWNKYTELGTLRTNAQQKETQHTELLARHTDLSTRHTSLSAKHTDLLNTHTQLSDENKTLSTNNKQLTAQVAQERKKASRLMKSNKRLKEKNAEEDDEALQLQAAIKKLKNRLRSMNILVSFFGKQAADHEQYSQNCREKRDLELIASLLPEIDQPIPLAIPLEEHDGAQFCSTGCELAAPPIETQGGNL